MHSTTTISSHFGELYERRIRKFNVTVLLAAAAAGGRCVTSNANSIIERTSRSLWTVCGCTLAGNRYFGEWVHGFEGFLTGELHHEQFLEESLVQPHRIDKRVSELRT